MTGESSDIHVSDLEGAQYLDGRLPLLERDRVEAHLAICPECRNHIMEGSRLARAAGRRRRIVSALIAASVLLVAALVPMSRFLFGPRPYSSNLRGAQSSPLIAYQPLGELGTADHRFVWGSSRNVLSYRLTITRRDGGIVWIHSGTDTVIALPDSVSLRKTEHYFWVADALLSDGGSRSTGLHEFAVR